MYAFERVSGDVQWKYPAGRPMPSDVVRHGDLIYANAEGDALVALEIETGSVRWRLAPSGGPRLGSFVSSPVIFGDFVVIAGGDGIVYALNAETGREAWRHDVGGAITSPAVGQDLIYVGVVAEDRVIALSAVSGSLVGEARPTESLVPYMPPVATDWGLAVVAGATLELWTADLAERLWQVRLPAKIGRSPIVWNGRVVTGTVRGHVVGHDPVDGCRDTVVPLTGVVAGLAGLDDVLYVGTQEGVLYAVRP